MCGFSVLELNPSGMCGFSVLKLNPKVGGRAEAGGSHVEAGGLRECVLQWVSLRDYSGCR